SFARAGISFDHYTRTATRRHHAVTQDLFSRLHGKGFVTEATQPAAFCGREGRSLPDRYVEGTCPACGAADARGDQCDTCGRTLDPQELGAPRCRRCGGPATLAPPPGPAPRFPSAWTAPRHGRGGPWPRQSLAGGGAPGRGPAAGWRPACGH